MKKLPKHTFKYFKEHLLKSENEKLEKGVYFPLEIYDVYIICLKVENIDSCAAYVFRDEKNHNLVFVCDGDIEDYIITHEICHLVFHVFDKQNIPIDYHNQEAFCFLLDHLYRKIMNFLKSNKKEWGLKKL